MRVSLCARRDLLRPEEQTNEPIKKKKKRKAKKVGPLSFDLGDEDDEDAVVVKTKKVRKSIKNPDVATDFLPDKAREQEEARERKRLRIEWEAEQERIKSAFVRLESVEGAVLLTCVLCL